MIWFLNLQELLFSLGFSFVRVHSFAAEAFLAFAIFSPYVSLQPLDLRACERAIIVELRHGRRNRPEQPCTLETRVVTHRFLRDLRVAAAQ